MAFVWGALLFGELNTFSAGRFAVLGVALVFVLAGALCIVRSQEVQPAAGTVPAQSQHSGGGHAGQARHPSGAYGRGLLWAGSAGVLWGSYFVPAQWAKVPAQVGNFPLALGIVIAGLALALPAGEPVRLSPKVSAVQIGAGVLFGIGNLALLGLVKRVGTGVGFTIAQLSLLVNASIGIWVFRVPKPGSCAARVVLVGIVLAGAGGTAIGALK